MSTIKQGNERGPGNGNLREGKMQEAMQGGSGEKPDQLRDISELLLTLGDIMMGRDDVHSAIDFYERAMKAERDAGSKGQDT